MEQDSLPTPSPSLAERDAWTQAMFAYDASRGEKYPALAGIERAGGSFPWRLLSREMYMAFGAALDGREDLLMRAVERCPGIYEVFSKEAAVSGLAARHRERVPLARYRSWLEAWGTGFAPVMLYGAGWWCASRPDRGAGLAASWAEEVGGADADAVWDGWGFRVAMTRWGKDETRLDELLARAPTCAAWTGAGRALWFPFGEDHSAWRARLERAPAGRRRHLAAGVGFAVIMTRLEELGDWAAALRSTASQDREPFLVGSARALAIRRAAQPEWTAKCLAAGGRAGVDLGALAAPGSGHADYLAALA